ncbi:MAG TPA: hypothetical protein VKI62_09275, partial [Bacteroidota bacterium]|nr:hypothetical protein [Bacteroidota bacterium]
RLWVKIRRYKQGYFSTKYILAGVFRETLYHSDNLFHQQMNMAHQPVAQVPNVRLGIGSRRFVVFLFPHVRITPIFIFLSFLQLACYVKPNLTIIHQKYTVVSVSQIDVQTKTIKVPDVGFTRLDYDEQIYDHDKQVYEYTLQIEVLLDPDYQTFDSDLLILCHPQKSATTSVPINIYDIERTGPNRFSYTFALTLDADDSVGFSVCEQNELSGQRIKYDREHVQENQTLELHH